MTDLTPQSPEDAAVAARRNVLKLGAIGATAIVSIQPAFSAVGVSLLNCEIPVPDTSSMWVAPDGSLVAPYTAGAFPPTSRAFTGEEVKAALQSGSLPYTQSDASGAYLNYIRKLRGGQSGFTCFASLQMPR
jgi:hypothetical protein